MLRIRTEFNERLPDGGFLALYYLGSPLDGQATELRLAHGMRVVLVSYDGDFEVQAELHERPGDPWFRWVAYADWPTIVRYDPPRAQD